MLHSICQQIWKLSSGHRTGKGQFSFQSQRKAMPKNAQTTAELHSAQASKVMLKILQARIQQYMNRELPDVQAGFIKGRGTRDQLPTFTGSSKKQENTRKRSTSASLIIPEPLTVWIVTNCGKFLRDGNSRPPYLPPEKSICRSGSNS